MITETLPFFEIFFPSIVIEWKKLDKNIHKAKSLKTFKECILKFIQPSQNRVYYCHNPRRIKILARFRAGLIHFHEHKFKDTF